MPWSLLLNKKVLGAAGLLIAALSAYFWHVTVADEAINKAVMIERSRWDKKMAEMQAEVDRLNAMAQEVKTVVETKYITRIQTVTVAGKEVIREIPVHVHDTCELSWGWVRNHNAAAGDVTTVSSADSDDAPTGISATQALEVVAFNYSTCSLDREKLRGLQEYEIGLQGIK